MYCNSNTYRTRVRELSLKVSVIFQLVIEVAHDHIDKGEGGLKGTCSDVKKKLLFHFFQTRCFMAWSQIHGTEVAKENIKEKLLSDQFVNQSALE